MSQMLHDDRANGMFSHVQGEKNNGISRFGLAKSY